MFVESGVGLHVRVTSSQVLFAFESGWRASGRRHGPCWGLTSAAYKNCSLGLSTAKLIESFLVARCSETAESRRREATHACR